MSSPIVRLPAIGEFFEVHGEGALRIDQIGKYDHGTFRVVAEDAKSYTIVWSDDEGWITIS